MVRAANETNAIKYQSAGKLAIGNQPKIFRTYPQGSAQLLSEKGACVTCFPYCFLYHSMHCENIALQGGCMHPLIFEGALSPVFAEFADRGKLSIELQQESAAFGGHPLSGFAGLPPIQGAE